METATFDFTLWIKRDNWKLVMFSKAIARAKVGFTGWEIGCDGTNTFALDRYDGTPRELTIPEPLKSKMPAGTAPSPFYGQAQIFAGTCPPTIQAPSALVWLTFASGSVLEKGSSGRFRQVWEFDDYKMRYDTNKTVRATWVATNGFPQSVEFINEGFWDTRVQGRSKRIKVPEPFSSGFTNATLQTLEWLTIGQVRIPKTALFERYSVVGGRLKKIVECKIEVISVSPEDLSDYLPQLPGPAIAANDYREYSVLGSPLPLSLTTAWPRDYRSVKQLKMYLPQTQAAIRQKQSREALSKRVVIVYLILGIFIITPIGLWILNRKQMNKQ